MGDSQSLSRRLKPPGLSFGEWPAALLIPSTCATAIDWIYRFGGRPLLSHQASVIKDGDGDGDGGCE